MQQANFLSAYLYLQGKIKLDSVKPQTNGTRLNEAMKKNEVPTSIFVSRSLFV